MEVDEAGAHDEAAGVDALIRGDARLGLAMNDSQAAITNANGGGKPALAGAIDDRPVLEDQVEGLSHLLIVGIPRPSLRPQNGCMGVAGLILAAGASTRFGSPKQEARIGDQSMLEVVIGIARCAGLDPVVAVVAPGIAVPRSVVSVINAVPSEGLSRSLRMGLAALLPETEAAVILLGDQPSLAPSTVRLLLDDRSGRPVVAAFADGRIGPPILLRRDAFGLVEGATGDEGLRTVLAAHPDLVTNVPVGVHARDVDTPADLDALVDGRAGDEAPRSAG